MKDTTKLTHLILWMTVFTLASLACESLQVGVVTPTAEADPNLMADETDT